MKDMISHFIEMNEESQNETMQWTGKNREKQPEILQFKISYLPFLIFTNSDDTVYIHHLLHKSQSIQRESKGKCRPTNPSKTEINNRWQLEAKGSQDFHPSYSCRDSSLFCIITFLMQARQNHWTKTKCVMWLEQKDAVTTDAILDVEQHKDLSKVMNRDEDIVEQIKCDNRRR